MTTTVPSPVRTFSRLDAVFAPRSIALIGASGKAGGVGRALLENLRTFPGPFFAVNPRHDSVLGRRCYPDIAAVPEPVDLAVIATPAATVPGIVAECAAAGVGAAIILSAGFREGGAAGRALEAQALAAARAGGLRLVGPNCLGVMNPHRGLNATFAGPVARAGNIGFLSQSGALCSAVLDWSRRENVGFSAFASVGAMADVGWGELIDHLGADPHTHSILLYMESVGDAASFLAAARRVAPAKPIIVLKAGRTTQAAQAAASHSGALAGRDDVFDAALRRVGVLRVDSVVDLFSMAEVLAHQPLPRGPRLAIVTNAGGPAALATDTLVLGGAELAPLSPAGLAALNQFLPATWSHGNPIDVLGDADGARFGRAVEIAATEPGVDGVLALLTPQSMTDATAIAHELTARTAAAGKPVLACWMGGDAVAAGRRVLQEAGIPTFAYPETAARAFAHLRRFAQLREEALRPVAAENPAAPAEARTLIARARQAGRTILSEYESKQLLGLHQIPSVETWLAHTEDEATAVATRVGFPVVLKLHSHTITHKSDVGGVRLGLADAGAVRTAWREIRTAVISRAGPQHFLGVTVQPMTPGDGRELILGSSADPQFGPVLLFGAGGKFVEFLQDAAVALPPCDTRVARDLMERTKVFALLRGARGLLPVPLAELERLIVRFSQFVTAHPEIEEVDLNPVVIVGGRCLVLDARVVLHPATGFPATPPPLGPALLDPAPLLADRRAP
jgi:acetyltransferase